MVLLFLIDSQDRPQNKVLTDRRYNSVDQLPVLIDKCCILLIMSVLRRLWSHV